MNEGYLFFQRTKDNGKGRKGSDEVGLRFLLHLLMRRFNLSAIMKIY
jgi:hypothetical protein